MAKVLHTVLVLPEQANLDRGNFVLVFSTLPLRLINGGLTTAAHSISAKSVKSSHLSNFLPTSCKKPTVLKPNLCTNFKLERLTVSEIGGIWQLFGRDLPDLPLQLQTL